jgi:hypothetical protein
MGFYEHNKEYFIESIQFIYTILKKCYSDINSKFKKEEGLEEIITQIN